MKFILFFYVLSLTVIISTVIAGDTIADTSFYHQYLESTSAKSLQEPIQYNQLPKEVLDGFSKSSFSNILISNAYVVPSHETEGLITKFLPEQASGKTYIIRLANHQRGQNQTTLKFTSNGDLIHVLN